ncbi:MAG: M90 family metallopeptidase [Burkholderiales bacterium]
MIARWMQALRERRDARILVQRAIPDDLWRLTLARFPFLRQRSDADLRTLRDMATLFLARKEFSGGRELQVSDEMAVAVAAQACLPVLKLGLDWYDSFVGIVIHPDLVTVRREHIDEVGVVHEYDESLAGEAMEGGPVMLSWRDVADAGDSAEWGYNVVIHEFAHVIDMRDGVADGVPPLPTRAAREQWLAVLEAHYEALCIEVDRGIEPLLDTYATESLEEFFAVASETFFVAPIELRAEHPALYAQLAGFYQQDPAANMNGR